MTEEEMGPEEQAGGEREGDDRRSARERVGDGIREGMGVLSAFKDALEETIQEARERGDLSADKAKEVVKDALEKAQAAGGRARDRLDFVHHADLAAVERALDSVLERVGRLEESVFGSVQQPGAGEEAPRGGAEGSEAGAGEAPGAEPSGEASPQTDAGEG